MARQRSALGILALGALLLASSGASGQTRTERLSWTHANPTGTTGYMVHHGTASRSYSQQVDVGVPPIVSLTFSVDVQVPATGSIYFAVTAYDALGVHSVYSNEIVRTPLIDDGSGGGSEPPPTDDGGTTTASSAVTGFKLVNALTGTVVDSDFRSGDRIDVALHSCVLIEIGTNAYLSKLHKPGSVKTVFDGKSTACNAAPISHENNPPYFWEVENDCAVSLTQVGSHELVATPFDGDDCTGAQGNPLTVLFDVINSQSGSGTIGRPGQPVLIP